ncbi:ZZ-type zinc finger-containing protein 3 [Trachymyrmex zeteki]|uniref:ZZ-type zinc finger-containing protein 3 n=1 Tax=Mycetomoellerius zeteki TaxID=64791 RepID=A0A151XG31_9HYME|nr:PREDICTED: ZZ-type zinc finger-containing protein 3 [Trachymyrmex zeteki]KYQ59240.1 ZZ-type zinc finger-containing protein 3 [Trachymyrmex zeteki]
MNDETVKVSNDSNEEQNEFYFESDHLALKGNKDYTAFLKTIVILEAQRVQAIKDLDKLMSVRAQALKDPISFVAQLQNGDLPELPGPQKIPEIPYIDWSQYSIALSDGRMRPQTRHGHVLPQMQPKKIEQENEKILVRGRAFDESKPETFNQLWTVEEQRRLEELLVEYPPEEVEMRRWTKIANALGNRTPKQVSSRVQKYFIKLLRAGLPIPGRGPKLKVDVKKGLIHKRNNQFLFKRSTFFPHQDISFNTSDESKEQPVAEESEDDTLNGGSDDSPEIRQLNLLRQVKAEKAQDSSMYNHVGYKCTVCEEPLKGTRWHCAECHSGIDLCGDCAIAQLEAENPLHDPSHRLIPIKPPLCTRSYDLDYFPQNFSNSSYNYLDPNFLPE